MAEKRKLAGKTSPKVESNEDNSQNESKSEKLKPSNFTYKKEENSPNADKESSSSLKTAAVNLIKGLVLVVVVPVLLNYAALVREGKELRPDGELVDIGNGQKLFKQCYGNGKPTVFLDAPLGMTSEVWALVAPALSRTSRVCMYDRAGLGFSDRPMMTRGNVSSKNMGQLHSVERMVEDFQKLLAGETKPYILVGADLGASVVKFYTQLFPNDVAALLFINPLFEGLFVGPENPWTRYWSKALLPSLQLKHICSALGLTRLGIQLGLLKEEFVYPRMPDVSRNRQKHLMCKPAHISSRVEESYFMNESLSQMRILQKIRPLSEEIPVTIVWTSEYNKDFTREENNFWQSTHSLYSKLVSSKELHVENMKGRVPDIFFSKNMVIVKHIETIIRKSRDRLKREAKY